MTTWTPEPTEESIQEVLDQAQPGDTVIIPPGTFGGSFTVPSGITIRSGLAPKIVWVDEQA